MQDLRRAFFAQPAAQRSAAEDLPPLQKAGEEDHLPLQHTVLQQTALHYRREKSGLHRPETRQQRRIRTTIISLQNHDSSYRLRFRESAQRGESFSPSGR